MCLSFVLILFLNSFVKNGHPVDDVGREQECLHVLLCPAEVGVCVHGLSMQGIYPWAFLQSGATPLRLLTQVHMLEIWKFCHVRAGEGFPNPERAWEGTKLRDPPPFLLASQKPPTHTNRIRQEGSTWADLTQGTVEMAGSNPLQLQVGSTIGKLVHCQSLEPSASGRTNSGFDTEVAKAEAVMGALESWCTSESPGELLWLHPQSHSLVRTSGLGTGILINSLVLFIRTNPPTPVFIFYTNYCTWP